ncbi:MAG: phosphatidate cytidylyltransferase [Betaproteobacteria bacterium]
MLVTRIATAVVLIVVVLGALFLLPPSGWAVAVLAILVAGAHEWGRLIGLGRRGLLALVCTMVVAGIALLAWAPPVPGSGWPSWVVAVVCGAATLFWLVVGTPCVLLDRQPRAAWIRASIAVVVLLGALVAVVELQARSPWLVLAAMAIVWVADTAAYFAGRAFGRRRLAPAISPGKSWEGAWGGIAAVIVYALALVPLAPRTGLPTTPGVIAGWIAFAAAVAALSIIGDLHESLLKRRAGVKDSGTLLPGHGGILDRTDALLAAMPPVALAVLAFVART